jgi:2-haloacid dehalogenase
MNEIRHIVLDLGQVLLIWDPERPYRRLIPDAAARRRFLSEVCTPAWNDEQDRGRSWREAEEVLIAEHPEDAAMIRAYRQNWLEMMPAQIDETVAVFDDLLAGGHDVTALTNFAADTFEEARARFPLLDRFRGVTVSGRIGVMKPELAIYRHHAAAFGLEPAAILFFDDKPDNVAGARAAGWHAEQFVDARRMHDDLARYGVPVL